MPNESFIDRIEQQYDDIARLGGRAERTAIFTNVTVIDASPSGLTNRVIIQDPRDGDYVPALKVPGIQYANNELVNVLFIEGSEPIAYQQGSGSSGSNVKVYQIWESDFGAVAGQADATGNFTWSHGVIINEDGDDFDTRIEGDTDANLLYIDAGNDRVGLSTSTPGALLDVAGADAEIAIIGDGSGATLMSVNGSAGQPRDIQYQTNGTNRWIVRTDATAETGSDAGSNFTMLARADDGSNIATAFFIRRSDQQFGMGVANPAAKLDISQSDGSAAVPVVKMNQLDVDEPFLLLRSAAAAATLTRALVDVGDVSTFTAVGYFKIEIDDTGNQITDGDYYVEFGSLA